MSTVFRSINPKNNKLFRTFEAISYKDLDEKIEKSYQRFRWKYNKGQIEDLPRRLHKLDFLRQGLIEKKNEYAALITQEMGKPITQSLAEIDRCIGQCDWYIANGMQIIQNEKLKLLNQDQQGEIIY